MIFKRIIKYSSVVLLLAIMMLLPDMAYALKANYPLEITQPQSNLDTNNRFYKAYPGLVYNVRLAVIGGLFPYQYELLSAPVGMTIDERGEINWPNPTGSGTPYSISVRVTDSESTRKTINWTITVTTNGFRFVDAKNGATASQGGNGSIGNPWKTLNDVYQNSKAGEFVYWREGTYYLDAPFNHSSGTDQVIINPSQRAGVWIAFPGEAPVFDFEGNKYDREFRFYGSNIYIDGLEFKNTKRYFIRGTFNQGAVFRKLHMHQLGPSSGHYNQAFIGTNSTSNPYPNTVIQDNHLHTLNYGAALKIYGLEKLLIEDNIIHNIFDSSGSNNVEGIALKQSAISFTVRGNTIYDVSRFPIGGNMGTYSGTTNYTHGEILYNYIYDIGNTAISINQNWVAKGIYVYRNTLGGKIEIRQAEDGNGPFIINNNVIIHDGSGAHIDVLRSTATDLDKVVVVYDNLLGVSSDGIIDANGNLSPSYSEYIGIMGHQLSDSSPLENQPLIAPVRFRVIK